MGVRSSRYLLPCLPPLRSVLGEISSPSYLQSDNYLIIQFDSAKNGGIWSVIISTRRHSCIKSHFFNRFSNFIKISKVLPMYNGYKKIQIIKKEGLV